jgi:flagellar basal-body rod modification protein FlgD
MAVDSIGAVASSTQADVPTSASIGQDDFLRILLTQLRFQDPLKPVDNEQFVAQLAQFSALEINRQQSEKVDNLLTIQAANQAVALIGKSVEVRNANGSTAGTVSAISFQTGEPRLTVNTGSLSDPNAQVLIDVKLSDIVSVNSLVR